MKIRIYDAKDAGALSQLYRRSVEQLAIQDYTEAQVAVWVSLSPTAERLHDLSKDGRARFVAVDALDHPLAFADLEADGHIHFLYCAPEAIGTGVAAALYDTLENNARLRNIPRLYTEASEAARRFLLKKAFRVKARRELEISGVEIHNYAMEKQLPKSAAD